MGRITDHDLTTYLEAALSEAEQVLLADFHHSERQRTASTYIFGAICLKEGKGAGLVLPFPNTETMGLHLAEIARMVAPSTRAVLLMDQAGWQISDKLDLPDNLSIVTLLSERS